MLININPVLSPELLFHLRSMGHGEKLILADANFPANTSNDKVIRLDGVGIKEAVSAILSVFPLDSFIVSQGGSPALRMEVDNKPDEITERNKLLGQPVVFSPTKLRNLIEDVGGFDSFEFSGHSFKTFTNSQMVQIADILGFEIIAGLQKLGQKFPENAAEFAWSARLK